MGVARFLKRFAERITNTHILRSLPRGVNIFLDVRHSLPVFRARVVFDVGANIGQSAQAFREHFTESTIYCFEPVLALFELLTMNVRPLGNVHCYQLAMGDSSGVGSMLIHQKSTMSRLESTTSGYCPPCDAVAQSVAIQTVDDFSRENRVESIDYLKVDTEGHDLAVVEGAKEMLNAQKIGMVQVEAGMNWRNTYHASLHDLQRYLEEKGYFLFGIYDQAGEWPTNAPHLRRCNAVFISRQLAQANTRKQVA